MWNDILGFIKGGQRMSDKKQIPERWRPSYESGGSHAICNHHKKQVIEELGAAESRVVELEQALQGLMKLVDNGILVCDTSHDGESGWAMRKLPIVRVLQQAQAALQGTDKAAKK